MADWAWGAALAFLCGAACAFTAADPASSADLAASNRSGGTLPAECRDANPHRVSRVRVAPGVELEVLDWGGAEHPRTLVMLTGLGDNAHVYDDFAVQFTGDLHVIGITRRGYLPSSQPAHGYDVATRARDVIRVLDRLGIARASFAGHSLAGSELSRLATDYPRRVDKIVYLDAYDLATRFSLPDIPGAEFSDRDNRSLLSFQAAQARLFGVRRTDASICHGLAFDAAGAVVASTTPDEIPAALLAGIRAPRNPPVDWRGIDAPRLGIFALYSAEVRQPHYWYLDAADRRLFDRNFPGIVAWQQEAIARFRAHRGPGPKPIVRELPAFTSHYLYINREDFVALEMRRFLLSR